MRMPLVIADLYFCSLTLFRNLESSGLSGFGILPDMMGSEGVGALGFVVYRAWSVSTTVCRCREAGR